ncbi:hypothetical protein BH11ACT2_BH11ACT2_23870 [soil metagenome]
MEHFIAPGIAFVFFLTLGFVCHSFRDVANRHSDRVGNAFGHASGEDDSHATGH